MGRNVEFHIESGRLQIIGSEDAEPTPHNVKMGRASNGVVYVAKNARVEVHGDNVELRVENVAGLEAHVDSGSLEAFDIDGPVEIHADRVDVALENVRGDVEVNTDSGDIEIPRAYGRIEISSGGSGDVTVQAATDRLEVCGDSGEIVLDLVPVGRRARYEVNSDSGSVTIRVPAGTGVRAELESDSGEVLNDTDGGDEVFLEVNTDSGDITVLAGVHAFG